MAELAKINPPNDEGGEKPNQPHLNVPVSQAFAEAFGEYMANLSLPIGSAQGALGRPSMSYALANLIASAIKYTVTDADRTSGRQSLTDEERKLAAALKDKSTRAILMAMLRDAGITL